jgi:hypothetical protein
MQANGQHGQGDPRRARISSTVFAVATILVASASGIANAQFSDRVATGARVRVWVPEPWLQEDQSPWRRQLLRGTVTSVAGDTMRIAVPGTEGTLAVARSSITRLDVSRGRPSRGASALERAFAGAIVGAISVALDNDPDGKRWPHYSRDWRAAEEGAKWGAAFGAVLGFAFPTERWRRVRLSR